VFGESSVMGSKLSETFTVETANSLMQAINAAQGQVQEGSDKESLELGRDDFDDRSGSRTGS
jgi:hypothetical protein